MAPPTEVTSLGWAEYLFTDVWVIGVVGWIGLLLSIVSLVVTIAGFVIALRQIRQVQAVSEASRQAADEMMDALRRQDVTASLNEARSHLKLARILPGSNFGAAGAYIDTSCNALTQVHQIRGGQDDDELVVHILNLRATVKSFQTGSDPNATRTRRMQNDIVDAINTIDRLIAQRKYNLKT